MENKNDYCGTNNIVTSIHITTIIFKYQHIEEWTKTFFSDFSVHNSIYFICTYTDRNHMLLKEKNTGCLSGISILGIFIYYLLQNLYL